MKNLKRFIPMLTISSVLLMACGNNEENEVPEEPIDEEVVVEDEIEEEEEEVVELTRENTIVAVFRDAPLARDFNPKHEDLLDAKLFTFMENFGPQVNDMLAENPIDVHRFTERFDVVEVDEDIEYISMVSRFTETDDGERHGLTNDGNDHLNTQIYVIDKNDAETDQEFVAKLQESNQAFITMAESSDEFTRTDQNAFANASFTIYEDDNYIISMAPAIDDISNPMTFEVEATSDNDFSGIESYRDFNTETLNNYLDVFTNNELSNTIASYFE